MGVIKKQDNSIVNSHPVPGLDSLYKRRRTYLEDKALIWIFLKKTYVFFLVFTTLDSSV